MAATVEPEPADNDRDLAQRIVIDDTAPFEFVPPPVQPLDAKAGDGLLSVVSLIVLGLAFFAGHPRLGL